MKAGEILGRFVSEDGRVVILRTPKLEDMDDLIEFVGVRPNVDYWLRSRLAEMEKGRVIEGFGSTRVRKLQSSHSRL
jgi:hypothetical protein